MSCSTISWALAEGRLLTPADRRHIDGCEGCTAAVERHRSYRDALHTVATEPSPSADFSARVLAQLPAPSDPLEMMAWAAWRTLPPAAALVLVLGLWAALLPPVTGPDVGVPLHAEDATLLWLLNGEETP